MKKLIVTLEDQNDLMTYKQYGVDEVVVALADHTFSALEQFTLAQIKQLVKSVHEEGMHISILMDRLFEQHELVSVKEILLQLIDMDVDYVMFADPALMMIAFENHFANKMIYRSLTMTTSTNDASGGKNKV